MTDRTRAIKQENAAPRSKTLRARGRRAGAGSRADASGSEAIRQVFIDPGEVGEALLAILTSSQAKAAIGQLGDGVRIAGPTAIAYGVAQVTGWDEKLTRRLLRALLDLHAFES